MITVTESSPDVVNEPLRVHAIEPTVVIQPSKGLFRLGLKAVWQYRELLYFLAWRDLKVRYKQTVVGAGWAIIQPLMTMVVFTMIFGNLAKIPSDGLPYPIFAFTALLPWNFFAGALSRCSASLVGNAHLISKVYFPRLIVPLSATVAGVADFGIAFVFLVGMMGWFRIGPNWGVLALPFFLLLALATALAVGLFVSALNVRYRDVGHAIPFLIQVWMFLSPVAYPGSLVPDRWRPLYILNPMAGVIEGFRWALLGKRAPDITVMATGATIVLVILLGGIVFFKRMERSFADVV